MNRKPHVAVVGATGAVGIEMIKTLEKRSFPVGKLTLLASARSVGKKLKYRGEEITVKELKKDSFAGIDLALFSAGGSISKEFAPIAARAGCVVIDNSSAFRMDDKVPLVIPEVNAEDIRKHQGIIASPNCSTTQMVVAVKPLPDAARVRRIVVSTYQATSGAGLVGSRDLEQGSHAHLHQQPYQYECFPYPIAFNCIPQIGSPKERGYTSEEMKMVYETRKMLHDDSIQVCATCVRVPVSNCHSESVLVETERKVSVEEAKRLLAAMPGVVVMDDLAKKIYPTPMHCDRRDEVFVGRIREDLSSPNGLAFWCVSDNLRKGAATNAVQIAEWMVANC